MFVFRYLALFLIPLSVTRAQLPVSVPAHITVQLQLEEALRATDVQPGDLVDLRVVLDIRSEGHLIVRHNVWAQGQVRYLRDRPRRRKPELVLVPKLVQAVNGSLISLYGDGLVFGGRGPGSRPDLPARSKLRAAVRYTQTIAVK